MHPASPEIGKISGALLHEKKKIKRKALNRWYAPAVLLFRRQQSGLF